MTKQEIYINGSSSISPQQTFDKTRINLNQIHESPRLQCIEPDYSLLPAGLIGRRMGKLTKIGVTTAHFALQEAGIEKPDAILTGTGLGCMIETEKFLLSVIENDEQMLNPTAFMQSTHNTLGGQIALQLKCKAYNLTYVHKGFAFESALLDGMMKIKEGVASNILVGGFDEMTEKHFIITQRMNSWKKDGFLSKNLYSDGGIGTIGGEGSTFFVLGAKPIESTVISVAGLDILNQPTGVEDLKNQFNSFLDAMEMPIEDIHLLVLGKSGDVNFDGNFDAVEHWLNNKPTAYFKHLCGEHYTSSAFALWLCDRVIRDGQVLAAMMPMHTEQLKEIKNILVYNNYKNTDHSLYLIKNCQNTD